MPVISGVRQAPLMPNKGKLTPPNDDGPIIDGFSYNQELQSFNPYDYRVDCLKALEPLRRAASYRPKIYARPDIKYNVANVPGLQPFTNIQQQVRMVPGTWIWGIGVGVINYTIDLGVPVASQSNAFNVQNCFYFNLRDDSTGTLLWQDWISEVNFYPSVLNGGGRTLNNKSMFCMLMSEPRCILDPGIVTIEISTNGAEGDGTSFVSTPQLILYCAEPCPDTDAHMAGAC